MSLPKRALVTPTGKTKAKKTRKPYNVKTFPSAIVLQVFQWRRNMVPQNNLSPCAAGIHQHMQREASGAYVNSPYCARARTEHTLKKPLCPAPISIYNTPEELTAAKQELGFVCFNRNPLYQLISKHITVHRAHHHIFS